MKKDSFPRIYPGYFLGLVFLSAFAMIQLTACGSGQEAQKSSLNDAAKSSQPTSEVIPTVDFTGLEKYLNLKDDSLRVYNFWATWCKPCVDELPLLEELAQKNNQEAFKLYYISLDFPNQIESKLKPFLKENPLSGEVIILDDPDANSWIDKVNPEWSGAIPATIVSSNGKNSFHEGKFSTLEEIEKLITSIK